MIVEHRANFAVDRAANEEVAYVQSAVLDENGGDRAAAFVHAGFEHCSGCGGVGIGFELAQVGYQQNHFEQAREILLGLGGDFDHDGVAAPLFGHQTAVGELALDALGLRVGIVDLVDGHDDGNFCGAGVIDRFFGLRHDAVIGADDEDDDVGDFCAAGAHTREGFVARRVDEDDAAIVDVELRRRRYAG